MTDRLDVFRKMLDRANWPVDDDNGRPWLIMSNGEIWQYRTNEPQEERIYRPLYSGRFQ